MLVLQRHIYPQPLPPAHGFGQGANGPDHFPISADQPPQGASGAEYLDQHAPLPRRTPQAIGGHAVDHMGTDIGDEMTDRLSITTTL
jgi:hypothetical protein